MDKRHSEAKIFFRWGLAIKCALKIKHISAHIDRSAPSFRLRSLAPKAPPQTAPPTSNPFESITALDLEVVVDDSDDYISLYLGLLNNAPRYDIEQ